MEVACRDRVTDEGPVSARDYRNFNPCDRTDSQGVAEGPFKALVTGHRRQETEVNIWRAAREQDRKGIVVPRIAIENQGTHASSSAVEQRSPRNYRTLDGFRMVAAGMDRFELHRRSCMTKQSAHTR